MAGRARPIAAAAVLCLLIAIHVFALARDSYRGPHLDEVEHLHTALRMARGERIFIDFVEHHSPLFYGMLMPFVPDGDGVDVMQGYLRRGRILSGFLATLAIAIGAFVVWRASGKPWAPLTMIALILASGGMWLDGLGDVRPESAALAIWWCGAALVLFAPHGAWRGAGVGVMLLAGLLNPKWPIASIAACAFFLFDLFHERRGRVTAVFAAISVSAAAVGSVIVFTDPRALFFYMFELTREGYEAVRDSSLDPPFFACPPLLRPFAVAPAAALVVFAWIRIRQTFASPRLVAFLLTIAVASICEILFVYPFPAITPRFYIFWSIPAAALIGLAAQGAAALFGGMTPSFRRVIDALPIVVLVLSLMASLDRALPLVAPAHSYWRWSAWMEARMRPGDTVWLHVAWHPIGARDANYYWFQQAEVVPIALRVATTERGRRYLPAITEQDLPPCRLERGLDHNLRFVADPIGYSKLPVVVGCFERLRARGMVTQTPMPEVWIVNR